jgi:transposase-like protein
MIDDYEDETGDETLVTEADVTCPHCGEGATISVDPGGGDEQEYVEDCPVCCRPWLVHLTWDDSGAVEAWLEAADE